jgi:hypothetical protein
MAITPYPGSDNDYENPSILASNDKTTWVVPDGLTNPIVPFPGGTDFNADCDMVLVDGTMYVFYLEVTSDSTDAEIYYKTSTDGITWSAAVHIDLGAAFPVEFKSPAFIKETNGWTMFYSSGRVYHTHAPALTGPWDTPIAVTDTNVGDSHVDVIKVGGVYYGIFLQGAETLKFGASWNGGLTWYIKSTDILTKSASGGWDDFGLYRSTIQPTTGGFDFWYTGKADNTVWRIGYTTIAYG